MSREAPVAGVVESAICPVCGFQVTSCFCPCPNCGKSTSTPSTAPESCQCSYELLSHALAEANRRLSDGMPAWIPVSERMPEESRAVLAFWGKDRIHGIEAGARSYGVAMWDRGIWRDVDDTDTEYGPATHWMPLPEAPK